MKNKVRKITVVLEFDESVDYEDKYELSEAVKEVADMIQDGYVRGYEHGNISSWETEYEYEEDDIGGLTGRNYTQEAAEYEADFKRYMELTEEEIEEDEKIYLAEGVAEFERYIEKISEKIGDPELTEALKKLKNGLK